MATPTSPASSRVDAAIIGGGIAGSSMAVVLQREGWTTALIEREPVFRDRVRGEGCHPWGVQELQELGLRSIVDCIDAVELKFWKRYAARQIDAQFAWTEAYPGGHSEIGFNHPRLQYAMIEAARAEGALIYRPATASITSVGDEWRLQVQREEASTDIRAGFLIAADGKNSSTRKLWGAEMVADPPHHQMRGMLVQGIDLPHDGAYQGFQEGGFSMIFPQGDDHARLYLVCPHETAQNFVGPDRVQRYLAQCGESLPDGVLDRAVQRGPLAFFPNNHVGTTRIDGPRAVAIGDAAGAGDPSQGHGMSLLWRDVRVLRDILASHSLDDTPLEFARQRRQYEHVLRSHAAWVAPITTDSSEQSVALKAQVEAARAVDPSALGYRDIFALGPDNLSTDAATRAAFFGEDLVSTPVIIPTPLDKLA